MPTEEILVNMMSALQHSHCITCFQKLCNLSPDGINSCAMVSCEQGCGARFHQCKQDDHVFVCQYEKVSCVNKSYGCPSVLPRAKLKTHLKVCPASVVRCVIEWNRWPMHSQEQRRRAPLPLNNPHVRCGQLDVALAFRDQRMLLDSLKSSKRTRKILQNPLTRRYPAVPFGVKKSNSFDSDNTLSEEASKNVSDEEGDAPWQVANSPPGLQKSICKKLYSASRDTTERLSAALDLVSNHMGLEAIRHMSLSYISEANENLEDGSKTINSMEIEETDDSQHSDNVECSEKNKTTYNTGNTEMETVTKDTSDRGQRDSVNQSETDIDIMASTSSVVSEPDVSVYDRSSKLHELLGLNISIECISKYQQKPQTMYTFLCAQEFRRDEYEWHMKNVHNEIQCGLGGWLEQRCPLAWQGCTWSFQRFNPNNENSSIVYDPLLESFGLLLSNSDVKDETSDQNNDDTGIDVQSEAYIKRLRQATPEIFTSCKYDSEVKVVPRFKPNTSADLHGKVARGLELTDLPFEVLQNIGRRLDGFGLSSLSLTCHLLRDVCCSLLEEMGIVVFEWEKQSAGRLPRWRVAYKRWQFSSSFTPIQSWKFKEFNPLSQHLKDCPYNQDKNVRTDKIQLLELGEDPSQLLHALEEREIF